MTFGRQLLAAAVVAPLLLGGCQDDPKPKIASPSPTPSASSSAPAPEPKEAWERKTKAGAVAFVEHWFEVFSAAINEGSSDALRALSVPTCKTCTAISDRIDSIERNGGFYKAGSWSVLETGEVITSGGETSLSVRLRFGRERFKETADSEVETNPPGRVSYEVRMRWDTTGWRMGEMTVLS